MFGIRVHVDAVLCSARTSRL